MLRVLQLACLNAWGAEYRKVLMQNGFSEEVLARKGQLGFGRY